MKISYAITVCNELDEVTKLLNHLFEYKREEDEIVVLFDKGNGTAEVWNRLAELRDEKNVIVSAKTFKNHFANWKNQLTELCSGDYIFQIDADETPNKLLVANLPAILQSNPDNEVYLVPRINTVKGLTNEHVKKWGWNVNNEGWVNWPDYQGRIYKRDKQIKWQGKVHERIVGIKNLSQIPPNEQLALHHPKTINRQERQNKFYESI